MTGGSQLLQLTIELGSSACFRIEENTFLVPRLRNGNRMSTWFNTRRIIVPFDFSDASASAITVAQKLARDETDIHILHVIPHLSATDPGAVWESIDDEARKDHARRAVDEALAERKIETSGMHVDVGIGDPGHVVVDLAQEVEAGLIVVPSHGRTGIARVVLGSVAERIVRHAHCPVLVLKK